MSKGSEAPSRPEGGELLLAFEDPFLWQAPERVEILRIPVETSKGPRRPYQERRESEVVGFVNDLRGATGVSNLYRPHGPFITPAHRRGYKAQMKPGYAPMDRTDLDRDFARVCRDGGSEREAERFALRYGLLDEPDGAYLRDGNGKVLSMDGAALRGECLAWWRDESTRVRAVLRLAQLVRARTPKAREILKSVVVWQPDDPPNPHSPCGYVGSCTVHNPETGARLWSDGYLRPEIIEAWRPLGVKRGDDAGPVWYYIHVTTTYELRKHQVVATLKPGAKPGVASRLVLTASTLLGAIWARVALRLCFPRVGDGIPQKWIPCQRPGCDNIIDTSWNRKTRRYCSDRCRKLAYEYRNPSRGRLR